MVGRALVRLDIAIEVRSANDLAEWLRQAADRAEQDASRIFTHGRPVELVSSRGVRGTLLARELESRMKGREPT